MLEHRRDFRLALAVENVIRNNSVSTRDTE